MADSKREREARPRRERREETPEFKEKVVYVGRVAKVVKGGRTFRFSVLVVVGNEKGKVGIGSGKASEVPEAIKKATEQAKKNVIQVPIVDGGTLPHEYNKKLGASRVIIKPAPEGTGVIAGGAVRPVLELAGVKNVTAKTLGSRNSRNVALATVGALKEMRTKEQVAALRGITVEQLFK